MKLIVLLMVLAAVCCSCTAETKNDAPAPHDEGDGRSVTWIADTYQGDYRIDEA